MNFFEINFPDTISIGTTGGPVFATTISITSDKTETRSSNWSSGRNIYKIDCKILSNYQTLELLSLFNICKGMATGFRFKDFTDNTANKSVIGTGNGTLKSFQLVKQYIYSNYSYTKTIYKPVNNSVKIYINNQETTNFKINYSTGIITFQIAPAIDSIITASFNFDIPVRFNTDKLEIVYNGKNKLLTQALELIEIKPL